MDSPREPPGPAVFKAPPLCSLHAFFDANVLLPAYLRTVFLDLADAGLIAPHWSREVLVELRRNLVSRRFGVEQESADRLLALMELAFPDAPVRNHARHAALFDREVDSKDLHVATATYALSLKVAGGAPVVLVSSNLKDLPERAFAGTAVQTSRPGNLLERLLREHPETVPAVLRQTCRRMKRPPLSQIDLLGILERNACAAFAKKLAAAWGFVAE